MLTDIFYILPAGLLNSYDFKSDHSAIAVEVNINDLNGLQNAYKRLSEAIIFQQFCLSVIITENIGENMPDAIISFFFFPGYRKSGGIPSILVKAEKEEYKNRFQQKLTGCALKQGFAQVDVKPFVSGESDPGVVFFSDEAEKIKKAYIASLYEPEDRKHLYVQVKHLSDINAIHEVLQKEEDGFKTNNHSFFAVKEQNKKLAKQLCRFQSRYAAAEREIAAMSSHIDILRSESQAAYLQNFYNNEYEILPTWYKRFGHIIKVLIGKRNLRSLFNDNKKKYKI